LNISELTENPLITKQTKKQCLSHSPSGVYSHRALEIVNDSALYKCSLNNNNNNNNRNSSALFVYDDF